MSTMNARPTIGHSSPILTYGLTVEDVLTKNGDHTSRVKNYFENRVT